MAYRRVLSLALGCLLAGSGMAAPVATSVTQQVPDGYRRIAQAHQVPPEALYSLALTESSARLPRGERPWPWTINVAGKGYRYATRLEAWRALQEFMRHTSLKHIDVGMAQVNLGWNGGYFASTWQAFDPYRNLNAAADILRHCWDTRPGSWLAAAGCYHHPAGGRPAATYTATVTRKLGQLQSSPVPAFSPASLPAPDSTLVWSEPRSLFQ